MRSRIVVYGLGCVAAFFATAAGAQYNQYGNDYYGNAGNTVRCESRDGRTARCGGSGDAQLLRQLSDSPCTRGRTWGTDHQGLWASQGCRGDFQVGLRGNAGNGQVFRCESTDNRARQCAMNGGGQVRIVRQLSSSPCIEGQSWGRDGKGVWVTRGCRAEFQVVAGRGGRWDRWRGNDGNAYGNGHESQQTVRCESRDERTSRCAANIRREARMQRQLSSSPCIEGRSWGWDRSGVWVSHGCRAEFSVW